MIISGNVVGEVKRFKYLGYFVVRDWSFVVDKKHSIKSKGEKLWAFYVIR